MKKKFNFFIQGRLDPRIKKMLMYMKLTCLIVLLGAIQVFAGKTYAQKTNISVNLKNATVETVLQSVEEQTDFYFLYSRSIVDVDRKVELQLKDVKVTELLSSLFAGTEVSYRIDGRQIVLSGVETNTLQQQKAVAGKVTDSTGMPLPGVSVVVKGTTIGTITDFDGNYNLANVPGDATLTFSFVGMKSQDVKIAGKSTINITLEEEAIGIEEVVAIGYGSMKKRDFLGSIASLNAEDIQKTQPTSMDAALQGITSGVTVTSSGVPGAPVQVKVRGINSISSGTDPLWIVDGIPVTSGTLDQSYNGETNQNILSMINPSDIESIQVLKDAAATSIYGSRGSNGVIVVTTKQGKDGINTFDVDISSGVSNWTKSDIGLASGPEYVAIMDLVRKNSRMNGLYEPIQSLGQLDNVATSMTREEALNTNTNWADEISRLGNFFDARIAASNGSGKVNSYLSLNYRKDNSIFKFSDLQTLSSNVNLNYKALDILDLGYKAIISYTDNNRVKSSDGKQGAGGWAQVNSNSLPWMKVYDDEGINGYWNSQSYTNALAGIDSRNSESNLKSINVITGLNASLKLPVKGLFLKGELGMNYVNSKGLSWISKNVRELGAVARESKIQTAILNYNSYLSYNLNIRDIHSLNLVAGVEGTRSNVHTTQLTGEGLVGVFHEIGTPTTLSGSSKLGGESYLMGIFSRANYNYKNKYYAGFSMRRDGISRFIDENRWTTFVSGSLGWIISEESFFNIEAINLLKLRGSFGQTGNTNVPTGITSDVWSITSGSGSHMGFNSSTLGTLGNRHIRWETTTSVDAGFDFGLLENRINGSVGYYRQEITDMLMKVPLPESAGIRGGNYIWQNVGKMENYGIEFNMDAVIINNKNFTWSVGGNLSTNKNKVLALDPESDRNGAGIEPEADADSNYRTITRTGLPIGNWYMAEFAGVDTEKGIPMIYEVAVQEDGLTKHTGNIIPGTENNINKNRMILEGKTSIPKFYGGLNTMFSYKMFDMNMLWSFAGGHYIYNRLRQSIMTPNTGLLTLSKDLLTDTWQKPGDNAKWPQTTYAVSYFYDDNGNPTDVGVKYASENQTPNSMYLEKGDYLRLKSLQIGYRLPENLARVIRMKSVRIYLNGTNLFTSTKFTGYDPEVEIGRNSSSSVVVFKDLPQAKIYSIGVNAKF